MQRHKPPFRADHVGSLLRPVEIKEARLRRERGEISPEELTGIEDAAIERMIAKQAETGLKSATDGEARRAMWHYDFLERLRGVELRHSSRGIAFQGGIQTASRSLHVTGKLAFDGHPMIRHFEFLRDHAKAVPKMTIPSPSVLHFRGGREAIPPEIYPNMADFYRDLGLAELLFNQIGVDGYFMEFDTERAGGFEPLRFVPKGRTVVLGLVTSKSGELENAEDLVRRIEQAARFADLDQLALSPQCGFASTEEGNTLSEEQQWAKLRRIVEVAEKVWG